MISGFLVAVDPRNPTEMWSASDQNLIILELQAPGSVLPHLRNVQTLPELPACFCHMVWEFSGCHSELLSLLGEYNKAFPLFLFPSQSLCFPGAHISHRLLHTSSTGIQAQHSGPSLSGIFPPMAKRSQLPALYLSAGQRAPNFY